MFVLVWSVGRWLCEAAARWRDRSECELNFRRSIVGCGSGLLFGDPILDSGLRRSTLSSSCSLNSAFRSSFVFRFLFSVSVFGCEALGSDGSNAIENDVTDAVFLLAFVRVATAIIFLAPISAFDQVCFCVQFLSFGLFYFHFGGL